MSLLIRTLNLLDKGPILMISFNLNYFLRGPFPNAATLEMNSSVQEFGGNTTIHSIIIPYEILFHSICSPELESSALLAKGVPFIIIFIENLLFLPLDRCFCIKDQGFDGLVEIERASEIFIGKDKCYLKCKMKADIQL